MARNQHGLRVYDSILGLLSSEDNPTPLVRLNRVVPFRHAKIYAKLEWYNPFGAVKDRVAANLIRDAEELRAGGLLLEQATGYDLFPFTEHIETLASFRRVTPEASRA